MAAQRLNTVRGKGGYAVSPEIRTSKRKLTAILTARLPRGNSTPQLTARLPREGMRGYVPRQINEVEGYRVTALTALHIQNSDRREHPMANHYDESLKRLEFAEDGRDFLAFDNGGYDDQLIAAAQVHATLELASQLATLNHHLSRMGVKS